jgi:hypothetical protein
MTVFDISIENKTKNFILYPYIRIYEYKSRVYARTNRNVQSLRRRNPLEDFKAASKEGAMRL